jgi:cbb3-type cytochrome oxidase cytochrome c subunit
MSAEELGKVSRKFRLAFAISSVAFLVVLAVSPVKDYFREWKRYSKEYVRYAQTRPDTKRLLADYHAGIDQIWIPEKRVVDRCTTCHQGITQASLRDPSVPQPFRAHPLMPHGPREWGCVICHRGQGAATEASEAHETTLAWEQPLLPTRYIQASCGVCHQEYLVETPQLNRGRYLLDQFNCMGCHRLQGIQRPEMIGPDLTQVGSKESREWIYKWLKEPRTVVDSSGNTTVNGYVTGSPRMPQFRLNEMELTTLSAYLSSLKGPSKEPYRFDPRVAAAWEKRPDLPEQGEARFRQMFCTTCHSLAVTRAGETKLIGGDIGPELTKVASKVNAVWLTNWLRDPQGYLVHSSMPRYQWSDEDLFKVTRYITGSLTDSDLLSNVPKLESPKPEEIQLGKRLFQDKGCAGCHVIQGIPAQKDFGPDLSNLGGKNVSQLDFGISKIPRNLISYIQSKVVDPLSVNPAARMPQYYFNATDLEAATTALLSMTGPAASSSLANLVKPRTQSEFRPGGAFGKVYERYQCAACHQFRGYGGTLAPDLTFEGSRAQRQWIIDFLLNPKTLRPTLTFRMPQFNMSKEEAAIATDYLTMVFQNVAVDLEGKERWPYPPDQAALGKQLYEVKYQCQACHTLGSSGGYVGPNLSDAGNWLNAAWIEAWLRNPQALVPAAIEPRRAFNNQEVAALTAYLMTLKQARPPKAELVRSTAKGGPR